MRSTFSSSPSRTSHVFKDLSRRPHLASQIMSVTPLSRNHCLCCRPVLQLGKALLKEVSQGERGSPYVGEGAPLKGLVERRRSSGAVDLLFFFCFVTFEPRVE